MLVQIFQHKLLLTRKLLKEKVIDHFVATEKNNQSDGEERYWNAVSTSFIKLVNKCSKLDVFPVHSHVSPIWLCSLWSPAGKKMNTILVREQIK